MAGPRRLIRTQRPSPGAVRVESIDGQPCLVAMDPYQIPAPGRTYDPLAWSRPRLWQALAELDPEDAEACATFASRWGLLLRPTKLDVRLGGAESPRASSREEYARGTAHQVERLAEWRTELVPFQVAAGLLDAWTRDDWTGVSLRIFPARGGSSDGWWLVAADGRDGYTCALTDLLPTEPTRERAAQLLHSQLATDGLRDHTAVADDPDAGPHVVTLSLMGAAWLSMMDDRVRGIRYKRCARCGEPVLILGGDRRSERAEYCGPACSAGAHKARQRARKKTRRRTR